MRCCSRAVCSQHFPKSRSQSIAKTIGEPSIICAPIHPSPPIAAVKFTIVDGGSPHAATGVRVTRGTVVHVSNLRTSDPNFAFTSAPGYRAPAQQQQVHGVSLQPRDMRISVPQQDASVLKSWHPGAGGQRSRGSLQDLGTGCTPAATHDTVMYSVLSWDQG